MTTILSKKSICAVVCSLLGLAIGEAAANTIGVSDSPLQTALGVPPNVLFVIDDSGSMRWGFTPDALASRLTADPGNSRDFPRDCDGSGNYAGVSNTCYYKTTNLRYLVSPRLNKAYFDPTKNYSPPVNSDGTQMANASFTAAPVNGYIGSSTTINLSTDYRSIMDDFY